MGGAYLDGLALLCCGLIAYAAGTRCPRSRRRGLDSLDVPPPIPVDYPIDAEHPPAEFED